MPVVSETSPLRIRSGSSPVRYFRRFQTLILFLYRFSLGLRLEPNLLQQTAGSMRPYLAETRCSSFMILMT